MLFPLLWWLLGNPYHKRSRRLEEGHQTEARAWNLFLGWPTQRSRYQAGWVTATSSRGLFLLGECPVALPWSPLRGREGWVKVIYLWQLKATDK